MRNLAWSGLADGGIGTGLLAPLAELFGLGWCGLLRLGGGVDLGVLVVLIKWWFLDPLASSVVLHLGDDRCSSVPQLVLHGLLEVVDGHLFPDVVDVAEAGPGLRDILEMAQEVVDVVLLGGTPHPHVGPRVHQVLDQLVLNIFYVALGQLLVYPERDGVGG